jgi:hypothetical protein
MVITLSDRRKIYKVVADTFQPTATIAKKLHMNWGVALGLLGLLTKDGYVESMQIMRGKSIQFLWKRTDKEFKEDE